jgi:hypothetical protein
MTTDYQKRENVDPGDLSPSSPTGLEQEKLDLEHERDFVFTFV